MRLKYFIIPILAFILGILIGGAWGVREYREYTSTLSSFYSQLLGNTNWTQAMTLAVYGTLLYEHRDDDLRRLIENEFQACLRKEKEPGYSKGLLGEAYSPERFIRGYFDLTKQPIPGAISQDIQSVPKGSGIDMLHFADAVVRQGRAAPEAAVSP